MPNTEKGRCAHPGCECTVAPGQQYCSTYCQQQSGSRQQQAQGGKGGAEGAHGCGCGHAACRHS